MQLKVIMKTCVSCVEACPAYKAAPFAAKDFSEFQALAQSQCAECFSGVKGPCPASANNHGPPPAPSADWLS